MLFPQLGRSSEPLVQSLWDITSSLSALKLTPSLVLQLYSAKLLATSALLLCLATQCASAPIWWQCQSRPYIASLLDSREGARITQHSGSHMLCHVKWVGCSFHPQDKWYGTVCIIHTAKLSDTPKQARFSVLPAGSNQCLVPGICLGQQHHLDHLALPKSLLENRCRSTSIGCSHTSSWAGVQALLSALQ